MLKKVEFSKSDVQLYNTFLTANFTDNLGICGGKIGVVIYLLNLVKTDSDSYDFCEDFAFELLDEIDNSINERTLVNFQYGLCGIGWGMEFLVKYQYLGVDEDYCLKFESKIQAGLLYDNYKGIGVSHGLLGYLLYFISRIESSLVIPQSEIMYMNKKCIIHVLDKMFDHLWVDDFSSFIEEKDNSAYGDIVPLVMSKWEYPILLWSLLRLCSHKILLNKVESYLERILLLLLNSKEIPSFKNNQILLLKVINSAVEDQNTNERISEYMNELKSILTRLLDNDSDTIFEEMEFYQSIL